MEFKAIIGHEHYTLVSCKTQVIDEHDWIQVDHTVNNRSLYAFIVFILTGIEDEVGQFTTTFKCTNIQQTATRIFSTVSVDTSGCGSGSANMILEFRKDPPLNIPVPVPRPCGFATDADYKLAYVAHVAQEKASAEDGGFILDLFKTCGIV